MFSTTETALGALVKNLNFYSLHFANFAIRFHQSIHLMGHANGLSRYVV